MAQWQEIAGPSVGKGFVVLPLIGVSLATFSGGTLLFRLGDTVAQSIGAPPGVISSRGIGAVDAVPGTGMIQLLTVGENMNDQTSLFQRSTNAAQWPPGGGTSWADWGGSQWSPPGVSYGPGTAYAFKISKNGLDVDTLSYCWSPMNEISWGVWWGPGELPTQTDMGVPQTISWLDKGQPQEMAVFCRGTGSDTNLYYQYQVSKNGSFNGEWKIVDSVSTNNDPLLIPWSNVSILVVNESGTLRRYNCWLKENMFQQWTTITEVDNVRMCKGCVVPMADGETHLVLFVKIAGRNDLDILDLGSLIGES